MKPAKIHRLAKAELARAVAYHERRRRGLGLELQDEIEAAVRRIEENPHLGSIYKDTAWRRVARR